jgi:hypothetical protein
MGNNSFLAVGWLHDTESPLRVVEVTRLSAEQVQAIFRPDNQLETLF